MTYINCKCRLFITNVCNRQNVLIHVDLSVLPRERISVATDRKASDTRAPTATETFSCLAMFR